MRGTAWVARTDYRSQDLESKASRVGLSPAGQPQACSWVVLLGSQSASH